VVEAAPWTYEDPNALGDPAHNHFYRVVGLQTPGRAVISRRVGEFDFPLVPGYDN